MKKTTWNYRVVKHVDGTYGIHEAYYTNAKLTMLTERSLKPYGMTYDELKSAMDMFKEAFKRDVIDEAEFNKEHSILPKPNEVRTNIEPPAFDYDEDQLKKLGELNHLHGDS